MNTNLLKYLVTLVMMAASLAAEVCAGAGPASVPASRPAPGSVSTTRPSSEQMRHMVVQQSHPVLARRREAIRQLAEWGPAAFPELRKVTQSSDHEAALSASELLKELQRAILIGAEIRLEVDRGRAAWNEPITLTVHAVNPNGDEII